MVEGVGGEHVSRKKTDRELDASRCTARSKATGTRCQRWAVSGARVCTVHGAGAPKRRAFLGGPDGRERKDPRTARLKHGLYSKRLPVEVARVVAEFQGDEAALYDLNAMTARLWVLLMRCDEVEAVLSQGDMTDPKAAHGAIKAIEAVCMVTGELLKAAVAHAKITRRISGLTERDLVAIVCRVLFKVREVADDDRIPRDKIADTLVAWVEASAEGIAA